MQEQLNAAPSLTLKFYPFGIILHKTHEDGGQSEYAVSPTQIHESFAGTLDFQSGLLNENSLYIGRQSNSSLVIEYRSPQITALFLETVEQALIVPLPGLLLARTIRQTRPEYAVYAVKERPTNLDCALFHAPLPNTNPNGICWGNVSRASDKGLASNRLDEEWQLLLGSLFTAHNVHDQSKQYPKDIRQQFIALEATKSLEYPLADLKPIEYTLTKLIQAQLI